MKYNFHFMARRRLFIAISGVLLLITIVSLATRGLNFGIDFRGGVVMDITTPQPVAVSAVRTVLTAQGQTQAEIQELDNTGRNFQFRFPPMTNTAETAIEDALAAKLGGGKSVVQSVSLVSPTIGRQLRNHAILAVLLATVLMTAYLGIRFQIGEVGAYSGLKFALAAVIALLHDITLTVGLFSVFHLTVNSPFVAAVLTVYGYSMNDTIIVFDRIRERLQQRRREPLTDLIDVSVNQVLNRTVTTVATVLLALLAVYSLGGASTRDLALALLVGVSFGTYSSVFIASPVFLWLARQDGGRPGAGRAETAPSRRRDAAKPVVATRI